MLFVLKGAQQREPGRHGRQFRLQDPLPQRGAAAHRDNLKCRL